MDISRSGVTNLELLKDHLLLQVQDFLQRCASFTLLQIADLDLQLPGFLVATNHGLVCRGLATPIPPVQRGHIHP